MASTLVDEPVYERAVCLIVHQDDSGTIGVMLNRPMQPLPQGLLDMLGKEAEGGQNRPAGE